MLPWERDEGSSTNVSLHQEEEKVRLKVAQSWQSSHTESFYGLWGSPRAAGPCVSSRVQNRCRKSVVGSWFSATFVREQELPCGSKWRSNRNGVVRGFCCLWCTEETSRNGRPGGKDAGASTGAENIGTSTERKLEQYESFNEQNTPATCIYLLIVIKYIKGFCYCIATLEQPHCCAGVGDPAPACPEAAEEGRRSGGVQPRNPHVH